MDEAPGTPGITPESRIRGLEQQVEQLAGEVQHYRKLYTDQLTRCALLERGIIAGKKAERLSDDGQVEQLSMQLLGMMFSALPAEATAQGDEGRPAGVPRPSSLECEGPEHRFRRVCVPTRTSGEPFSGRECGVDGFYDRPWGIPCPRAGPDTRSAAVLARSFVF